MKHLLFTATILAISMSPSRIEAATPIQVDISIKINRVDGNVPALASPLTFSYSVNFDASNPTIYEDGARTYTWFALNGSGLITSDVFSLLPRAAQVAEPSQGVSGRSDDYRDVFIDSIAFSDQRFYDANGYMGQTVTELFFDIRTPSRGGTGTADHPISIRDIADILSVGKTASFFIFDRIYDPANTRTTWSGTATIERIAISVPEPATWALMLAGFGLTGYALRRRKAILEQIPSVVNRWGIPRVPEV